MGKFKGFLGEVLREVHPTKGRVVWPTWDKLSKSTVTVIVASTICGLVIWLYDSVFSKVIAGSLLS